MKDSSPMAMFLVVDAGVGLEVLDHQVLHAGRADGDVGVAVAVDVAGAGHRHPEAARWLVAVEAPERVGLQGAVEIDYRRFLRADAEGNIDAVVLDLALPDLDGRETLLEMRDLRPGLPVVMAGDRERAGRYVSRLLFTAARREWRKLRALAIQPKESEATK